MSAHMRVLMLVSFVCQCRSQGNSGLQLPSKELDSGDYRHETSTRQHGWFCFGEENDSSRRVILKIELELNNLNSILSRSAVTQVFPLPLAQAKACRG